MIVAAPEILSPEWMIIGRQWVTGYRGKLDLLALAPDGALIIIELKRAKTPRDVVAQAIDYASWAESLDTDDIARIYADFSKGETLAALFKSASANPWMKILGEIKAIRSSLLPLLSTVAVKRIVNYLNKRDIAINVLFFQVFDTTEGSLLSRAWLLDPIDAQVAATTSGRSKEREPWNGEYYASYPDDETRSWDEAVKYGFICAGGGLGTVVH